MSDLISRQAAIDAFYVQSDDDGWWTGTAQDMEELLQGLPSADVVEVVRCKDCKHFHYDMPYVIQGIPVLGHEVCDFWGDGCKTDENGFCSYAERRTDAEIH